MCHDRGSTDGLPVNLVAVWVFATTSWRWHTSIQRSQSAFDEFAPHAFEENACDYLLKPFTAACLHSALPQALARIADAEKLHRNNIVCVPAVSALTLTRQGEMWLELVNGMKLSVSRAHRRTARELFQFADAQ